MTASAGNLVRLEPARAADTTRTIDVMGIAFLTCDEAAFARAAGAALRRRYGEDYHRLANDAGCNERTARNWLAGINGPRGLHLCRLIYAPAGSSAALLAEIERALRADPGADGEAQAFYDEMRELHRED